MGKFLSIIAIKLFLLLLIHTSFGQKTIIYGKDFDYQTLKPKETFQYTNNKNPDFFTLSHYPKYFVQCEYENDSLRYFKIIRGYDNRNRPLISAATVTYTNGGALFEYGVGKLKNYQRQISKKVKYQTLAFLRNDTLVYRTILEKWIHIQFATNIFSDSISISDKYFPNLSYTNKTYSSPFINFNNFKNWDTINNYTTHYKLTLKPNQLLDRLSCKQILETGLQNRCNSFGLSAIAYPNDLKWNLFWIKHLGLIY